MQNNKLGYFISAGLLVIPLQAKAFLSFCFPFGFIYLIFILMWPYWLVASILPGLERFATGYNDQNLFIVTTGFVGFLIDLAILIFLGKWIDKKKNGLIIKKWKRWSYRLPLIFCVSIVLVLLMLYFDIDFPC